MFSCVFDAIKGFMFFVQILKIKKLCSYHFIELFDDLENYVSQFIGKRLPDRSIWNDA